MRMNIYLIRRNDKVDYDQYAKAIVIAKDIEQARNMHPSGGTDYDIEQWSIGECATWIHPVNVEVIEIGKAIPEAEKGVVCADFKAG